MKICIVTSSFPRYQGDYSGFFAYEQAVALSQKHEVHVIYPTNVRTRESNDYPFYCHPIPYPFKTYPAAQVHGIDLINSFRLFISMSCEIRKVKRSYGIELFYAFWTIPSAFICSLSCGKTPFLVGVMGSDIAVFGKGGIAKPFVKFALKRANRIVVLCKSLKHEAIGLGAKAEKITIIPSGIDTNIYKPRNKEELREKLGLPDGLLLIYVGSLFKLKRVDRLIETSAKLRQNFDFHVLILGDGPERQTLENMARELGLANVHFLGRLAHDDVPLYMSAANSLVLLSETEGLPSCVQEAMASGMAIVATDVGGLPDIVKDDVTGYLVKRGEDVAPYLRKLMTSPDLIERLGFNALNLARYYLSSEKTLKQIMALCESIVEHRLNWAKNESESDRVKAST